MKSTMDYEVFICLAYNKQHYNLSKYDKFQIKKPQNYTNIIRWRSPK